MQRRFDGGLQRTESHLAMHDMQLYVGSAQSPDVAVRYSHKQTACRVLPGMRQSSATLVQHCMLHLIDVQPLQVYDLYSDSLQQLWRPGDSRAALTSLEAAELEGHQVKSALCLYKAHTSRQAPDLRELCVPAQTCLQVSAMWRRCAFRCLFETPGSFGA